MEMNYCPRCGLKLRVREHPTDGPVQYCARCEDYRYPLFSTAISLVITDPACENMLLIRQYGEEQDILAAGYVDKGERAEDAARRELKEELGLEAESLRFIGSRYYAPSETLMLNFHAVVRDQAVRPNFEVDSFRWLPASEALRAVRPGNLAERLLLDYFRETEV